MAYRILVEMSKEGEKLFSTMEEAKQFIKNPDLDSMTWNIKDRVECIVIG